MQALILVDLQNDFAPGSALPVPEGDHVVPIANEVRRHFDLIVATQDWHPANHHSFAANHLGKKPGDVIGQQVLWPVHCVQGSPGAELLPGLDRSRIAKIFRKGDDPAIDSYSGFFDNGHQKATGLGDYLKERGVTDVYVLGLATDYCVKFTALDARELGFHTILVQDASRGVNLKTGDVDAAIEQMRSAGVRIVQSSDLPLKE